MDGMSNMIKEHMEAMEKKMRESNDPRDRVFMHMKDTANRLNMKIALIQLYAAITKEADIFETLAALFEDVAGRIDSLQELIEMTKKENFV